MAKNPALIVIPSRLASSRLPNKPLAKIGSEPMIIHVWKRAILSNLGPVIVACGDQEIADVISNAGGTAIITDPRLQSGSDRIWAATQSYDPKGKYSVIINVQGDLPTLDPQLVTAAHSALIRGSGDIGTIVAKITEESEKTNPNVVKAAVHFNTKQATAPVLYFSRQLIPWGEGPFYHHIGIYAYKRNSLEKFVNLQPDALEMRESLEQLRALNNGMTIMATQVDTIPLGVDTPDDLQRARDILTK
ncbi:MAG: 3-deoxy-manno-octulosonate cytidylyltransferase [Rhodospirillaceae bacterium]|nr:3-deoxy-manno-octulosonate cytidylyltransferase [Rhodospirillaceae bacterium]